MSISKRKLESLCVRWQSGKFFYPKVIAKERGPRATILRVILAVLVCLVDLLSTNVSKITVGYLYSSGFLLHVFLHILYRCSLMAEEINHLKSRYEGSLFNMLKNGFYFRTLIWVMIVISTIYSVYFVTHYDVVNHFDYGIIFVVTTIYLIGTILHLDTGPLNDSLWLSGENGLNYGSGMAYSFFHGYLKIVLPQTESEEKNHKELMREFEDTNGIKFSAYKLFILIPNSLKCFVGLNNEYSPSVEDCRSLPEKIKTVAGVKGRVYKNAVYKITDAKNKKHYLSAEYATPLKTFNDVLLDTMTEHSAYYAKHKKDIILQFFLTLNTILDNHGLSESCELIFYEDSYRGDDNKTYYYDVGQILLTRLDQLNNRKKNN